MKVAISIFFLLLSYTYGGAQMDQSYLFERIQEKKSIDDPIARDSQLIWQYNYTIEELARTQDERVAAYVDTLRERAMSSSWPSAMAFYHRAMGRMHDFRGEFANALEHYDQAIQYYADANGELKEYAFTYVLKAFLLSNAGYYPECMATIEEGLPIARAAKGKNSLCLMLDWYGDYYYYGMGGEVDNMKALSYYKQVNEILPQISYARIIADNFSVLSGVYGRLDDMELSDNYFAKADSVLSETNLPNVKWGLYAERAKQLEQNGDYQGANDIYTSIMSYMDENPNKVFRARYYKALYENYKALNQPDSAIVYLEKYMADADALDTQELKQKYDEIQAKYELSQKNVEIERLHSKQRGLQNMGLIALLMGALIGVYFYHRSNQRLKTSNQALAKAQKSIKESFVKGELSERQRIASDLHDNVNTKIAATKWRIEAMQQGIDPDHQDDVKPIIDMMDDVYQDVRNIAHNLAPSRLMEVGLVASLKEMAYRLNESHKIHFDIDATECDESLITDEVYQVYNIVFELINNILKHSAADVASVKIATAAKHLNIIVTDNGKGFSPDHQGHHGLGLSSIRERLRTLDGEMEISSTSGEGTRIQILLPIST